MSRQTSSWRWVLVLTLCGFCGSSIVDAQDAPRRRGKITIDAGVLQGKIRKPQVQYIINREKGINQEAITLKESFVGKVVEAVKETPF